MGRVHPLARRACPSALQDQLLAVIPGILASSSTREPMSQSLAVLLRRVALISLGSSERSDRANAQTILGFLAVTQSTHSAMFDLLAACSNETDGILCHEALKLLF